MPVHGGLSRGISQIRRPKSEGRRKPECKRNPKNAALVVCPGFGFLSALGFRPSDFPIIPRFDKPWHHDPNKARSVDIYPAHSSFRHGGRVRLGIEV